MQTKLKASRGKEITKVKVVINKIENSKTIEDINKNKAGSVKNSTNLKNL